MEDDDDEDSFYTKKKTKSEVKILNEKYKATS